MGNLEASSKWKKNSKNGKRFLTSRDMAIVKHDDAVRNSKAKRGEITINVKEILKVKNKNQLSAEDKASYEKWLKERTR